MRLNHVLVTSISKVGWGWFCWFYRLPSTAGFGLGSGVLPAHHTDWTHVARHPTSHNPFSPFAHCLQLIALLHFDAFALPATYYTALYYIYIYIYIYNILCILQLALYIHIRPHSSGISHNSYVTIALAHCKRLNSELISSTSTGLVVEDCYT